MKAIKTLFQRKFWMKEALGIAAGALTFCFSAFVSLAATGTITADNARVRAEANGDSEVIGSTTQGKVVDVLEAVKDSSGTIWYKVPNGNNTYGYIRGDLIKITGDVDIKEASSAGGGEAQTGGSAPADTVPTSIGEQQATIAQDSVRIRSGASTQHDTVASLPQGTAITLIGEANDSAGNKWYQMTCSYNGRNVEGYVRSDLITIGSTQEGSGEGEGGTETGENPEGENPEGENPEGESPQENTEPQPQEPEHNDYEVVYDGGEEVYWLYNNTDGTRVRVEELLNVAEVANTNIQKYEEKIQNQKIIIIVLAVVIVVLVIAVTILLFKIRDLYYTDYEDYDEDEEEEPEPEPVRKKKKRPVIEEEEEEAPPKKKRPSSQKEGTGREKAQKRQVREEAELQAAERKPSPKKTSQRKPQNFLLDDDEFEFEFLNMDDKDL